MGSVNSTEYVNLWPEFTPIPVYAPFILAINKADLVERVTIPAAVPCEPFPLPVYEEVSTFKSIPSGTFPSEIYYQKAPGEVFNVFKMTQFAGNGVNFIMRILNLQSNTRSQMFCNPDFVVWSEDDHFKDKVFNITRCLEKIDVVPFPT